MPAVTVGGEWLTLPEANAFYEALIYYGDEGAWDPVDMITLMAGECDLIRLERPNAHGYQGPTQIGARELRNLGWKDAWGAFCKAPPATQVEYAARYFAEWRARLKIKRWTSAGHLWACNLAPAHLTRADGVVYDQLTHPKQVAANRWLDRNRDGIITRDELTDALLRVAVPRCRARYELALASLAEVRGQAPPLDVA
jgi:hypothetical protein